MTVLALAGAAYSAEVKYDGKPLSQIDDILGATHGNFEIAKHSLLYVERLPVTYRGSETTYEQAYIYDFDSEGNRVGSYLLPCGKEPTGDFYHSSAGSEQFSAVFPAFSNIPCGTNGSIRTLAYFSGSNKNRYGTYPFQTTDYLVSSSGNVSLSGSHISEFEDQNSTIVYGSGASTVRGYDGDIFVFADAPYAGDVDTGMIALNFISTSRKADGSIGTPSRLLSETAYETGGGGLRFASIVTGDIDNDGYKNDIALLLILRLVFTFVLTVFNIQTGGSV